MAHTDAHSHDEKHSFDKKAIWRSFWILLVITCVELGVGMFVAPQFPYSAKIWFNIFYIILTLAKAFYIIAELMHLKYEVKNLIMTVAIPALLFIWFITAFLWEGDSFKKLNHSMDSYKKEVKTIEKPTNTQGSHHEEHLK